MFINLNKQYNIDLLILFILKHDYWVARLDRLVGKIKYVLISEKVENLLLFKLLKTILPIYFFLFLLN